MGKQTLQEIWFNILQFNHWNVDWEQNCGHFCSLRGSFDQEKDIWILLHCNLAFNWVLKQFQGCVRLAPYSLLLMCSLHIGVFSIHFLWFLGILEPFFCKLGRYPFLLIFHKHIVFGFKIMSVASTCSQETRSVGHLSAPNVVQNLNKVILIIHATLATLSSICFMLEK